MNCDASLSFSAGVATATVSPHWASMERNLDQMSITFCDICSSCCWTASGESVMCVNAELCCWTASSSLSLSLSQPLMAGERSSCSVQANCDSTSSMSEAIVEASNS